MKQSCQPQREKKLANTCTFVDEEMDIIYEITHFCDIMESKILYKRTSTRSWSVNFGLLMLKKLLTLNVLSWLKYGTRHLNTVTKRMH